MKPDNTGKRLTHSGIFQDADDVHLLIFDTYKNKNKFLLFTDIAEIQANKEELNEGEGVDDN